ncbi:MAG: hypothetical protein LBF51_11170 [Zoogloeaceae bacterium]|jgi:spermidine synthase|nr:hypothetical protein [Zoogloeaceae bacterium]
MSKGIKIILGGAAILFLLGVILVVWLQGKAEEVVMEQGKELFQKVESFVATLPEEDRAKFQECWQQLKSPELKAKAETIAQERLEKTCGTGTDGDIREYMACATNLGVTAVLELSKEHFGTCKQQIGR